MNSQQLDYGTILIVDDNPANLDVLSDFLDSSGFEVLVAQDGMSAIDKVNYAPPHLILLDIMMPGIDGFETCRRLKANPDTQEIPIIFTSALADTVDKVKGLSLGAVDYITKPFQQEEVLARVRLHLKLYFIGQELAQQNSLLEQRVSERTAKLNQVIQELQTAQVQLIQSEKMSSLGQLVAGVAHEINNPVNFIFGNLTHANDYTSSLLEIIKTYQDKYPDPDEDLQETLEELELEFLIEDLPKLLRSMQVGAERIREIVLSLRKFSRIDEAELKAVDIHDGIDTTLMILHNRIKVRSSSPEIEIIRDYGELPHVECYSGQLNQVFMNLLANAIDALEEKRERRETTSITISTRRVAENRVRISIADNGLGMEAAVRDKIFNPFFTTKPIGKGTGMGLAIAYSIVVEKHNGSLVCLSQPGQGTEFVIEIPGVQDSCTTAAPEVQKVQG
jgi:signal transduction histidine kinase